MKSFDFVSDLHLDFYSYGHVPQGKQKKMLVKYVQSLLPDEPSDVIIIGGDISHYNVQFIWLFNELKNHYKHILFTTGNHDRYLINNNQCKKYDFNSDKRIDEIREIADRIDGVHYLDGTTIDIEGTVFGGFPGWHDGYYCREMGMVDEKKINDLYFERMMDGKCIKGLTEYDQYMNEEMDKLLRIVDESHVIVSHYGPMAPPNMPMKYQVLTSGFYYYEGREILSKDDPYCTNPLVYIFGHTHDQYDFMYHRTNLISNPIGYPHENWNAKIRNYIW